MDFPPSPLWSFSLAFYRKPGVAEACLALQDRHGIDVNLLLAALFAGARGIALEADAWVVLEGAVGAYHREVVQKLRAARRALKPLELKPLEEHAPVAAQLRSSVKAAELDAEHLEQLTIERTLAAMPAAPPGAGPTADRATANALAYLEAARVAADAADRALIARLAAAIPPSG
jgi:uncharacterized protein (TIGR02444 family)